MPVSISAFPRRHRPLLHPPAHSSIPSPHHPPPQFAPPSLTTRPCIRPFFEPQSYGVMRLACFATLATRTLRSQAASSPALVCDIRAPRLAPRPSTTRMCATGPPAAEGDSAMAAVQRKITDALAPTRLKVTPTYGDPNGSHVSITVVSDRFEGLSPVKRHQVVYKTIWEELSGPIHAVDELVTKTPSEDSS